MISEITESLLLALSVSYFARLDSQNVDGVSARTKFEGHICQIISKSDQLTHLSWNNFEDLLLE